MPQFARPGGLMSPRGNADLPDTLLTEAGEDIITEAGDVIVHEDTEPS